MEGPSHPAVFLKFTVLEIEWFKIENSVKNSNLKLPLIIQILNFR